MNPHDEKKSRFRIDKLEPRIAPVSVALGGNSAVAQATLNFNPDTQTGTITGFNPGLGSGTLVIGRP
jgi:hypothetical protein